MSVVVIVVYEVVQLVMRSVVCEVVQLVVSSVVYEVVQLVMMSATCPTTTSKDIDTHPATDSVHFAISNHVQCSQLTNCVCSGDCSVRGGPVSGEECSV